MQEPPLLATACPTRFKDRLSLEEVFSYGWFSGDGVPALCLFLLQRNHVGTGVLNGADNFQVLGTLAILET